MGLDMYLRRHNYVKNWDWKDDRHDVIVKKNGKPRQDIDPENIVSVIEEVCYWRKFNALHGWFVENVQGGNDDCGEYYVDKSDIVYLLETLNEISDDPSKAGKLFPPYEGFFFGSTEVDDYYWGDVRETIKVLDKLINTEWDGQLFYSSSW